MSWRSGEICHLIIDEDDGAVAVSLFQRKSKNKNPYYARFKVSDPEIPEKYRYLHQSLKTEDFEEAKRRAHAYYQKFKFRTEAGLAARSLKVGAALDKFLDNYRVSLDAGVNGFSASMLRGFRRSVDTYWRYYLGLKDINSVSIRDLEGYELWRREWAKAPDPAKKRKHGQYKTELSRRTLEWEVNAFKQFLRWCAARGLYAGKAYEWKFKKGERHRRSALTLEQYRCLTKYLDSAAYLRKGKHGHDMRIEWHRKLLRTYIIFLANTGLRVGEARFLRWKDLSERHNSQKVQVGMVRVSSTHSKVKRQRNTVANHAALKAWSDWREYRESLGDVCSDEAFVFCNMGGETFKDLREGFNSVIREAGVETDAEGLKFTPYSLRHTYITLQLQYAKDLRIYSLAKNCGTSVQMIEQFYSDAIPEDFIDELTGRHIQSSSFEEAKPPPRKRPYKTEHISKLIQP